MSDRNGNREDERNPFRRPRQTLVNARGGVSTGGRLSGSVSKPFNLGSTRVTPRVNLRSPRGREVDVTGISMDIDTGRFTFAPRVGFSNRPGRRPRVDSGGFKVTIPLNADFTPANRQRSKPDSVKAKDAAWRRRRAAARRRNRGK